MGILGLLKNFLIGTWHKFLIATHFKTLLSPWHRAQPSELGATKTFGDKILNAIVDFYIRVIADDFLLKISSYASAENILIRMGFDPIQLKEQFKKSVGAGTGNYRLYFKSRL